MIKGCVQASASVKEFISWLTFTCGLRVPLEVFRVESFLFFGKKRIIRSNNILRTTS